MTDRRHDERIEVHLSARIRPELSIVLDLEGASGDAIHNVIVTDLSGGGFAMLVNVSLFLGASVMIDVPLIGWREARVVWMGEKRIGCQFAQPLSALELKGAVASDDGFIETFPGLASRIGEEISAAQFAMPQAGGAIIELHLVVRMSEQGIEVMPVSPSDDVIEAQPARVQLTNPAAKTGH
ncbi:PilZ domain-containing protein [Sphingomonas crocodyli]|uniref:PilZ domain-containing protein n=1 Tax=Sphingomonas crocodyli TaxID=1979270 RepID=A0A437M8U6_9SPHN|nr:PilZ domain-containing protein [Sphingomonas crocodyli]RVT94079.1 PilZ domain-containing protein [Sphingomonas crocodyli]